MGKGFKKILAIGFAIASMTTIPTMAYTNNASPFEFVTGDNIKMHVGDNADLILARLPEPNSFGKIGQDDEAWYYRYDGFVLYTSKPEKGKEAVTGIEMDAFCDNGENTQEGIGLGSTEAEMLKRYGNKGYNRSYNKKTDAATYIYKKGDSKLSFIVNCFNKIIDILYSY